jgi:hypothetical protein
MFLALCSRNQLPGEFAIPAGIGDLIVAVTMGFLTSPSPLQMFAFDRPNLLITQYPLVMVPAFLVPTSIILHGLSLWKQSHEPLGTSCRHQETANAA